MLRSISKTRLFFLLIILSAGIFAPPISQAHQQPTTIVLLDVKPNQAAMELQIPLSELELAFGHDAAENPNALLGQLKPELRNYLLAHIHPETPDKRPWTVELAQMKLEQAEQTQSGPYQEITVHLLITPPAGSNTRHFVLNYDVIMHQVVTHKALIGIRSDWETGKTGEQTTMTGIIAVDTETMTIFPLTINLPEGSFWDGFKGMVNLGMQHIRESTNHLLFLLVLLLPATLTVKNNRWGEFGGGKYSVGRLLRIVTAFTVGHSITLLVGASGGLRISQQSVEVLIAVSILIAAVHAVRPIFPGKETYVAAGFGLIHGLALASVLANFDLGAGEMALSILGFNIGIELMQLLVIALTIPWLILLSLTPLYKWVRIFGAAFASVIAVGWIAERVSGNPNNISSLIQNLSQYAHLVVLILAVTAILTLSLKSLNRKYFIRVNS